MRSSDSVFVKDGRAIAVVGGKGPIPLASLSLRIVMALGRRNGGITGTELARELGVSPAAISQATVDLVKLGIVRKEPLAVARNIKLYFLAVTVVDEEAVKRLRAQLPPIMLRLIGERFKGNEALATVFVGQLLDYVKSLPESDKVLEDLMKQILGSENAKDTN